MSNSVPAALTRLIGQHPAALRSVRWTGSGAVGRHPEDKEHLEIETKQGLVALIDHRDGSAYSRPPVPPDAAGERQARDLTEQLPVAFDQRPVIEAIKGDGNSAWRFELSTGSCFVFEFPAAKVTQR
ncbi:MAG: hypothetical protein AAGE43_00320 [Pseudomonadota bacterium]